MAPSAPAARVRQAGASAGPVPRIARYRFDRPRGDGAVGPRGARPPGRCVRQPGTSDCEVPIRPARRQGRRRPTRRASANPVPRSARYRFDPPAARAPAAPAARVRQAGASASPVPRIARYRFDRPAAGASLVQAARVGRPGTSDCEVPIRPARSKGPGGPGGTRPPSRCVRQPGTSDCEVPIRPARSKGAVGPRGARPPSRCVRQPGTSDCEVPIRPARSKGAGGPRGARPPARFLGLRGTDPTRLAAEATRVRQTGASAKPVPRNARSRFDRPRGRGAAGPSGACPCVRQVGMPSIGGGGAGPGARRGDQGARASGTVALRLACRTRGGYNSTP